MPVVNEDSNNTFGFAVNNTKAYFREIEIGEIQDFENTREYYKMIPLKE